MNDRGIKDCRLAVALGNLGTSNFNLGFYVSAERQMKSAAQIWEDEGPMGTPGLVRSLANLIALYVDCCEYAKAKAEADRVLVIPTGQSFSSADRVHLLNNVARLHESMRHIDYAESLYAEAIRTLKVAGMSDSREMAIILNNRGCLRMKKHRYQEARSDFAEAISIMDATVGSTQPALVDFAIVEPLVNMAHAEIRAQRYTSAQALLERALEITKGHTLDSPREAQILSSYVMVLQRLHRNDEARSADRRAKELQSNADVNRRTLADTVAFRP